MREIGDAEADPVWPMPLWSPYDDELSSKIADLGNVSASAYAGSPIAALFLKRFVDRLADVAARRSVRLECEGAPGPARRSRSAMRAEPLSAHPRALRMIAIAPRHVALLVGITFIWGLNLVVSKIGMAEIPPILFTFLRFAILAVMLAPVLRIHRGQMSALVVAALLSGAISYSHELHRAAAAPRTCPPIAIAGQLGVPITTLLSVALLGEVVRWRRWTGILLSFAGVFIMGFDPQIGGRWETLALAIGAGVLRPRSG